MLWTTGLLAAFAVSLNIFDEYKGSHRYSISLLSLLLVFLCFALDWPHPVLMMGLVFITYFVSHFIFYRVSFLKHWPINLFGVSACLWAASSYILGFSFPTEVWNGFTMVHWLGIIILTVGSLLGIIVFFKKFPFDESKLPIADIPEKYMSAAIVIGSVVNSLREEIFFRFVLWYSLLPFMTAWQVNIIQSLLFGAIHIKDGVTYGWAGFAMTASLGALLGWQFILSGSLWTPIVAHALIDMVLLVYIQRNKLNLKRLV